MEPRRCLSINFLKCFPFFPKEPPEKLKHCTPSKSTVRFYIKPFRSFIQFCFLDFDEDGYLNKNDLTLAIQHLGHDLLHTDEVAQIVEKVRLR